MPVAPSAVLDSSVLVPAWSRLLLSTLAASRPILYTPVWCEWIIAETWRVLTAQRLRRLAVVTAADERQLSAASNAMLTALLQVMRFVTVVPPFDPAWAGATDAADLPIWSAAVRAGAEYVISHNLRDFPPRNADGLCAYAGVEFITTANFVADVLGLDLDTVAPMPVPPGGRMVHQRLA
ncbi:MAG TPA: PIN domain-containing protein [Chloroflexota bacterium]|nr:PIN domain-containing protein [Chloroflexota bacterium]